jgi:hypothetical protein
MSKQKRFVKIIAQSEIYSVVELIEESKSEGRLKDIREHYQKLVAANELRNADFEDKGLLVTTHLIKE